MQDQLIVQQVLEGDQQAYRLLVERYQEGLIRFCYSMVLDVDMAHDIAQESFIMAYQKLHQYNPKYAFSTWIYRIARNQALRQLGQENRKIEFDENSADASEPVEEMLQKEFDHLQLVQAMQAIAPQLRAVLHMYYWEDKSYQQISEELETPINTVRTWLRRAKLQLRKELTV